MIGNHDTMRETLFSKPDDSNFIRTFKPIINNLPKVETFGLNYTFVFEGYRFICLDFCRRKRFSGIRAQVSNEQIDWLKSILETSSEPCIICAHHPFVSPLAWGWQSKVLHGLPTLGLANFSFRDYWQLGEVFKANSNRIIGYYCGHGHTGIKRDDKKYNISVVEIDDFMKSEKYALYGFI